MHLRYALLPAFLLLAACAPMREALPGQPTAASSSFAVFTLSGAAIDDADVTLEPFEDPLAPLALTGAVTVEERVLSGGILEIGSADAPLTVTVFLHPESPYSQEFQRSRMPALLSEFVARGLVNVHAFILPIKKYASSAFAGRAVSCAMAQGKGYPALNLLVGNGRTELTDDDLADLALERTSYVPCMQTGTDDPLATSGHAAALWNVTLVPSYVIDGETFTGLPTEADLFGAVRAALR